MNELHMNLMVWTHLAYLGVSAAITVWVGRCLQRNGKIVATDGDPADREIVDAFARLLEVGFYLVSFGAINVALKYGGSATGLQTALELVSTKVGVILLILGGLNMALTLVFSSVRHQRRGQRWNHEPTLEDFDANRRRQTVAP